MTVGLGYTRNLSLWRSAPAPAPPPSPPLPPPTPEQVLDDFAQPELITATTPVPESTTSVSEFVTSLDIPSTVEVLPLNYGDLAALGFSHWTPAGVAQWTMELIQVSSGMSWFWTIVSVTLLSRLVLLPFNLSAVRSAARLAPHQRRLTELKDQLQKTGFAQDPIAVQRISLEQKKIYEEAGVSVLGPLMAPLTQLPVSLGLFFGIKKLCDFPLEQLKVGGFGWITDLTVADPMYVLPFAMAAVVNMQLSVSAFP